MLGTASVTRASCVVDEGNGVDTRALLAAGLEHHRAGRMTDAHRCYREILTVAPRHADALHLAGLVAYNFNEYVQALDLIDQAIAVHPSSPIFWSNRGTVCESLGRTADAEFSFRRAVDLNPGFLDAWLGLGALCTSLQRTGEAEQAYRHVLARNPMHARAILGLGKLYQSTQRYALAEQLYRQLLTADETAAEAHNHLGSVLKAQDRVTEALHEFEQAVQYRPAFAEAHYNRGLALQCLGRPIEAEAAYRQAIAARDDYQGALTNLGSLLFDQGRIVEAESLFRRALRADPASIVAHRNLAAALQKAGQLLEALQCIDQALVHHTRSAELWLDHAKLCLERDQMDAALASLEQALIIDPNVDEAWTMLSASLRRHAPPLEVERLCRQTLRQVPAHLGALDTLVLALLEQGRVNDAVTTLRNILSLRPDYVPGHLQLGSVLYHAGHLAAAKRAVQRALDLAPDHAKAHACMGAILQRLNHVGEAEKCFRRALAIDERLVDAHGLLATLLIALHRLDEAEQSLRNLLALRPDSADGYTSLGLVLYQSRRYTEAEQCLQRALALAPKHAAATWYLGMLRLKQGRLREGWERYEWRTQAQPDLLPEIPRPIWDGSLSLSDKTILLTHEQGFGDTLQFVRYVSLVTPRARNVILAVPPPLGRLFASSFGSAVTVHSNDGHMPAFDTWCSLMSLPHRFGTTLETIPTALPYLTVKPEDVQRWKARMEHEVCPRKLRVGLVWAGNARKETGNLGLINTDARRSMGLRQLGPLARVANVAFFSLQKGEPAAQTKQAPEDMHLIDYTEDLGDFYDTAALVMNLDLVISVDTSVAHLAGALGKPVWLLSRFDGCWRWLDGRTDSPWYPTMRLFRQKQAGKWEPVVAEVERELSAITGGHQAQVLGNVAMRSR